MICGMKISEMTNGTVATRKIATMIRRSKREMRGHISDCSSVVERAVPIGT